MQNMQRRYQIYVAVVVLLITSLVMSISTLTTARLEVSKLHTFLQEDVVAERLSQTFGQINDFPGSAGKDLLFLRTLSSMEDFYDIESPAFNWRSAHQDLQQFLERNSAYEAVYLYVDTLQCVVVVRRVAVEDGESVCGSISEHAVKDIFENVASLRSGQVYVSSLTAYDHPGGKEKVPGLLYGTKVSLPASASGAIVAVVNADYFLEEVRRMQRTDEHVFIIDQAGNYIVHPDQSKELWNGGEGNFYQDYPEVSEKIELTVGTSRIISEDKLFTFMHIAPSATNFVLYNGGENNNDEYWMLAAVSDMKFISWYVSWSFILAILFITFVHLVIAYVIRMTILPRQSHTLETKTIYEKQN